MQRWHRLTVLGVAFFALVPSTRVSAQQPAPKLTLVRELRIDGASQDLSGIGALLPLPDGSIVFVEPQDFRLRFYDSHGKEFARLGRRGNGPGEFNAGNAMGPVSGSNVSLGLIGDTIVALDGDMRRFSLITKRGQLLRTIQPSDKLPSASKGGAEIGPDRVLLYFVPKALLAGGSILGIGNWGHIELVDGIRMQRSAESRYAVAMPTGDIDRTIAEFPHDRSYTVTVTRGPGFSAGAGIPFANQPYTSVSPDGSRVAIATTRIPDARSGALELTVAGVRGDTLVRKTLPFTPQPFTRRALDSAVAFQLRRYRPDAAARGGTTLTPAELSEMESKMRAGVAKGASVYRRMELGADNSIWLRLRSAPDGATYEVLDERGALVGIVTLPKGSSLASGSLTTVWVEESDANDLPSLVRYKLSR